SDPLHFRLRGARFGAAEKARDVGDLVYAFQQAFFGEFGVPAIEPYRRFRLVTAYPHRALQVRQTGGTIAKRPFRRHPFPTAERFGDVVIQRIENRPLTSYAEHVSREFRST